jgi:hypothetical protein
VRCRLAPTPLIIVVLVLASACTTKTPTSTSPTRTSPSPPPATSAGPVTSPPITCTPALDADVACRGTPSVSLLLPGASSTVPLGSGVQLEQATQVLVADSGLANIFLSRQGVCTLEQDDLAKTAKLTVRFPEGALFRQEEGRSHCTVQGSIITACDTATIEITTELSQFRATCNPDPVITIAVFSGTVFVRLADAQGFDLGEGQELVVFPDPQAGENPQVGEAVFDDNEKALFGDQTDLVTPTPPPPPIG